MIDKVSFKEFRPTIIFLVKFIGFYFAGNLLYGLYVTGYKPKPDPITQWVTTQTVSAIRAVGYAARAENHSEKATTLVFHKDDPVISVFEGCNGVNTVIIFAGFLFAFGPYTKRMLWFLPAGMVIIHVFNIFRIGGLFFITLHQPGWLYFTHKYLFTAFIYAVIFILWLWWVKMHGANRQP